MKIGFIGLGNMATAIIGGILDSTVRIEGQTKPLSCDNLIGSAKTEATCNAIHDRFLIQTTTDNIEVAAKADVIVLAVKPQFFPEVISEIREESKGKLIISIAAGLTLERIALLFDQPLENMRLVRCMPNLAATVGTGCIAICEGPGASEEDLELCGTIMSACGNTDIVPERLMDTASAVGASSPAFVFMFIEALADGAVAEGMPRPQAYQFASQAVVGSALLALQYAGHPGELKDAVCSPGGTTIEGVRVLEEAGFRAGVMNAIRACVKKAQNL